MLDPYKTLRLFDHAYGSGPVFLRPATLWQAVRQTKDLIAGWLVHRMWRDAVEAAEIGDRVRLGVTTRIVNRLGRERIRIGAEAVVRGTIRNEADGTVEIGPCVYVGNNVVISCFARVIIGEGTLLAHDVQIFDNNSHPVDAGERVAHFRSVLGYKRKEPFKIDAAPVRVGKRAWIGMGSIILKGVTIGDDSIVAAGSVVTEDVPAGCVVAGNPAQVVKTLDPGRQAASWAASDTGTP